MAYRPGLGYLLPPLIGVMGLYLWPNDRNRLYHASIATRTLPEKEIWQPMVESQVVVENADKVDDWRELYFTRCVSNECFGNDPAFVDFDHMPKPSRSSFSPISPPQEATFHRVDDLGLFFFNFERIKWEPSSIPSQFDLIHVGHYLVATASKSTISIWNRRRGALRLSIDVEEDKGAVTYVQLVEEEGVLLTSTVRNEGAIWSLANGAQLHEFPTADVHALYFHNSFLIMIEESHVRVMDVNKRKTTLLTKERDKSIPSLNTFSGMLFNISSPIALGEKPVVYLEGEASPRTMRAPFEGEGVASAEKGEVQAILNTNGDLYLFDTVSRVFLSSFDLPRFNDHSVSLIMRGDKNLFLWFFSCTNFWCHRVSRASYTSTATTPQTREC